MPAKTKVTKEMIIDAAFEIVRKLGTDNVNVRAVAEKLGCSTQPIMYHFATIDDLKKAVYEKADKYHSQYLMQVNDNDSFPSIGYNYIKFAMEEPYLFRFLFQSNYFNGETIVGMIDSEELLPVLLTMQNKIGGSIEEVKEVFLTIFLFVHGYASLIANNALVYDEKQIKRQLENAYRGAIATLK